MLKHNSIHWMGIRIVTCALWACVAGAASVEDLKEIQARLQGALLAAREATVAVGSGGSGVIVSEVGHVLCAAHVTGRPGRTVKLTLHDGRQVSAETLGNSEFADAGMLKIRGEESWPFASMAVAETSAVGDWCFALGHPSGYDAARGVVVRIGRVIAKERNVIRTDCQLIGGDSGGPLFNLAGEVIGIHSRVSDDIEDNYHAPIEAFRRYWEPMIAGELIPRRNGRGGGYLGVRTSEHTKGVLVETVLPGSAAAGASFEAGWIITQVGGYAVASPEEFGMAIRSLRPGDEVTIEYLREETSHSVEVKLGARPDRRRRVR